MIKRNNKKGFTIVELVIVIAVIAILAAVLIPTFAGIINKAQQSADQQAVRQMNTLLAAEDITNKPTNVSEAIIALDASDIDMKDYKPLAKNMYFYWVAELNRVVYADKDNKVVFPEDLAGQTYSVDAGWYSLSGIVEEDDSWEKNVSATGAVDISSGAQLVSLMKAYADGDDDAATVTSVKLTADVDLKGASASFGSMKTDFTFDGNNKTIYGMRVDANTEIANSATSGTKSYYGYGLFGGITAGEVIVKNATFDGVVIYDTANVSATSTLGVIAASVNYDGKLTIENVDVVDCFVYGQRKVAALVGLVSNGSSSAIGKLTLKGDIAVSGKVVAGNESAKLVGAFSDSALAAMDTSGLKTLTVNVTVDVDSKLNDCDKDRPDVQKDCDYSLLSGAAGGNIK